MIEPIHFTMKELRLWAVTQRISEAVLNQQFEQFLKDQRKTQAVKLTSENSKTGKSQAKSSRPGPSKPKGRKLISKDQKLTPLTIKFMYIKLNYVAR